MTHRLALTLAIAGLLACACRGQAPAREGRTAKGSATANSTPTGDTISTATSTSTSTSTATSTSADGAGATATVAEAASDPGATANAPAPARPVDVTPPTAPAELAVEATSERSVALRWSPSRDDVGVVRYEVLRADAVVATVKRPGAREEGLRPGTSYCYTVRAYDAARNASPPAGPVCAATPDLTPPTPPAQLTATALGETEIELAWTASSDEVGVTGYEVVREGRVVAGGPSLAAREKGLRAYAEYCYTARAYDAAGNRSAPSPVACGRTPDLTPPTVPQHAVASATSDRSVQVLWQASADNVSIERYEVLRDGQVVATPTAAWTEEQELHPGVRYCYTVRAVDQSGNRSQPSKPACATTPDVTPPSVPDAVASQPVSDASIFVTWAASSDDVGVAGYEVVRDHDVVAKVAGTDLVASGLAAGKHCFRVRAVDAAGNRSALSPAVCGGTAAPSAPPAPFRLRAEPASEKAVALTWQASPQPGMVYRVYWENGKNIGATRLTGFSASGLKPGERHCYSVAAVDDQGDESPRTLEACAASRTESLSSR